MNLENKKNIFVFGFTKSTSVQVLRNLKKDGFNVLYWNGSKKYFEKIVKEKKEFRNTIFHNTYDAIQGVGAKYYKNLEFEPIDNSIISKLLFCESQAFSMMPYSDTDIIPLNQKKHVYYKYIRYWHGVLKRLRPDVILFDDIPHIAFKMVVFHLAKLMGIKVVICKTLHIYTRVLFFNDFYNYSFIKKEIEGNKKNYSINELSKDLKEYYLNQVNDKSAFKPFYVKNEYLNNLQRRQRVLPNIKFIFKNLLALTFLKTSIRFISLLFSQKKVPAINATTYTGFSFKMKQRKWLKIKNNFKKEYESLQKNINYSKKFIYLALHNQPECSTSAMGGVFTDQILMIDMLSASLPEEWILYVKETPLQWIHHRAHLGRYIGYYKEISKRKNVILIPAKIPSNKLIKYSQAVATVTGTVALEAVFRKKPVLMFGKSWHMYCEGVLRVKNSNECKQYIKKIKNGFKPDAQKIINFLAIIDKLSIFGYSTTVYNRSNIPEKINAKNMSDKFKEEILKS